MSTLAVMLAQDELPVEAISTIQTLVRAADLTGVVANAILGGLIARSERFDPIGFGTLAILSGLGGGIIRDTLLQAGPPVALLDWAYITSALAGAAIAYFVHVSERLWKRVFPWIDAIALGSWAAAGAQKTIMLGTITAVGGGATRDIVLRRVPSILGGNTLYATPAGCGIPAGLVGRRHPARRAVCEARRWRLRRRRAGHVPDGA